MKNSIVIILVLFVSFFSISHSFGQIITEDVRVAWDYSSTQQIAEGGGYPRMICLKDSSRMVIYETYKGDIQVKRSSDNGATWGDERTVFSQFSYSAIDGRTTVVNMANPEIIQLRNGDVAIACNYRPDKSEIAPYSIVIRRSEDGGRSWLPPQTLYVAAPRFDDGCWEPSFLQLPNGELQVYFANENPYQQTDEQEISMVHSADNGKTWTREAVTVSFRSGRRDGMPVPVLLKDEIVVAIEDNKTGEFKPYIVRTNIEDNWSKPVLANSSDREYALKSKIADSVYMGAPYLIELPNGQTLLSYQTNENRSSDWVLSTMEVAIGSREAKDFGLRTRPFPTRLHQQAKWNSLSLWDENTIVALSSVDLYSDTTAPWLIKGYLIPERIFAEEEITEYPIFIGSESTGSARIGISGKKGEIQLRCIVSGIEDAGAGGMDFFFYMEGNQYKLHCDGNGNYQLYREEINQWQPTTRDISVTFHENSEGYEFLISVFLNPETKKIRFGAALSSFDEKGIPFTEYLVHMEEKNINSWIEVYMK